MSSNLTISTRSSMKIEDAVRHLNKYLDNRIRKYMNCRNTMHENIKKAALNDRGRGVIRKEILHINYSANSKLVWRRDPPGEIITFIQYESPCWIEENQTDQETDPTTMVKQ